MSTPAKHVAPDSAAEQKPLRFVTAASLFDGHDAAINIMRRLIQAQGAEVIHLGHNRSVEDVVRAALQEDADAIALSSYQGGHVEYFKYMVDMLKERGAGHIRVFGGGGGTITPEEIRELEAYGVERIYHPNDGMKMGLVEMIEDVVKRARAASEAHSAGEPRGEVPPAKVAIDDEIAVGHALTAIEEGAHDEHTLERLRKEWQLAGGKTPVVGITGTGGAGKSSVVDELLLRFLHAFPQMHIAVLAVDPTRRRSGGALLGDRIRMNSLRSHRVFMRSMATRRQHAATSIVLKDCIAFLKGQGYDLVIVETAGIGQSDSEIVDLVDFPMYVMTSDYGAASQLEKIDMLDFAELVVLNKFDKRGAEDALRDVRKQWKRNRVAFQLKDEDLPVYPSIASQFNDPGVTWMFTNLCRLLREKLSLAGTAHVDWQPQLDTSLKEPRATVLIPGSRVRYLAEIAEQGRAINARIESQAEVADRAQAYWQSLRDLEDPKLPKALDLYDANALQSLLPGTGEGARRADEGQLEKTLTPTLSRKRERGEKAGGPQPPHPAPALQRRHPVPRLRRPARLARMAGAPEVDHRRGQRIRSPRQGDPRGELPRIALATRRSRRSPRPPTRAGANCWSSCRRKTCPATTPTPAACLSVPPHRRGPDPHVRRRGHARAHQPPLPLPQPGPARRAPVHSLRQRHTLRRGPRAAPGHLRQDRQFRRQHPDAGRHEEAVLRLRSLRADHLGVDDDQRPRADHPRDVHEHRDRPAGGEVPEGRPRALGGTAESRIAKLFEGRQRPLYHGDLPATNNGLGLGLLGVTGNQVVDAETYEKIKAATLSTVRGTVQADILKEDQAQNTCIFSTEFALRMMGDIQQYFVDRKVRNFYSVSISGYHIAEAGANPISQLAFTLSNGLTIVEYYLARGMRIDDFAPNLSFFFSNGMDPEYTVIGRVARRIWARAMRERYGANERSQMMKYHIQTSGRSLHAQEIQFNDIRTTLQALYALFDNCNSLHTNAYDEAITTPTEESVRRAVAIQMIINKELGLNFNENPGRAASSSTSSPTSSRKPSTRSSRRSASAAACSVRWTPCTSAARSRKKADLLRAQEARRHACR